MFIYDIYIYVYLILYAHITLYYHVKTVYTMDCLWFRSQYWAACRTLIAHRRQRPPVRWRPGWNMVKRVSFQGGATNQKSSEIKHKKQWSDRFGDHFILPKSKWFGSSQQLILNVQPSNRMEWTSGYTDANWTTGPPTGLVSQHEMAFNGLRPFGCQGKWCKWMDGGMENDG